MPVVADVVLQLQANWMADYRNSSGIVLDDGPTGPTLTIEDSSRVDPWIVRQAQREAASCTERLAEFSRRDRPRPAADPLGATPAHVARAASPRHRIQEDHP